MFHNEEIARPDAARTGHVARASLLAMNVSFKEITSLLVIWNGAGTVFTPLNPCLTLRVKPHWVVDFNGAVNDIVQLSFQQFLFQG